MGGWVGAYSAGDVHLRSRFAWFFGFDSFLVSSYLSAPVPPPDIGLLLLDDGGEDHPEVDEGGRLFTVLLHCHALVPEIFKFISPISAG